MGGGGVKKLIIILNMLQKTKTFRNYCETLILNQQNNKDHILGLYVIKALLQLNLNYIKPVIWFIISDI